MRTSFDYIVVGAGSSGCAAAYRLARESNGHVLLLEAGSPAKNPMLHMPLGFAFLLKEHTNNWNYKTQPEKMLKDREIDLPRGKVMGGCSAINGMVYVRGQHADYDHWQALGNTGWSSSDVLPYFKLSEDNENGSSHYHGTGGPLWVGNVVNEFPISNTFIQACEQAGHRWNDDINADTQEGVAWFPHNIKKGKRWSAHKGFIQHAGSQLDNLTVLPFADVKRVMFEGTRATGVECMVKGKPESFKVQKEVILCAGAINSPKILELSGIGQKDLLQKFGIPVVRDLPGVGENLHDHWNAYIKRSVANGKTYFAESKPLAMIKNLFRYLFTGKGFLGNPAALVAVFYKATDEADRADAQIHFAPAASELDAKGNMIPIDGITIATCGTRPSSRGSTHITSADMQDKPAIHVNYLDTEHDKKVAVEAFKKARKICAQTAMQALGGEELEPGPEASTDEAILDYICETGEPVHHLAGSCKMGNDDMAVVDHELKVHGIEGLRVADASIMPEIISGNTHAPCVMIGEKVAAMILATHSEK